MLRVSTILIVTLLYTFQGGESKSHPTSISPNPHEQERQAKSDPEKRKCDFSSFKALKMHSLPPTKLVKPVYPPEAIDQKVSGTVLVKVIVDRQGKVLRACAIEGDDRLRRAAEMAALESNFAAGMWNSYLAKRYRYAEFALSYNLVM
jgi:Gram-negative bacterial TonB protein C-terminal